MKNKNSKAFTLVELIVVITILAILGTIAFISLQGYSSSARNSRRISDVNNIKTSLELFILNSGVYPTPDNYETVSYGGDDLWYQGVIGDNVTKNLSKNLSEKPTDPLYEIDYTYSTTNTKKEYELLAYYEGSIAQNQIFNQANASTNVTAKIIGNYNQLYVKSANYIVPTPSIINAEVNGTGMILNENNIKSQILSEGENIPNLNINGIETQTGKLEITLSVFTGSITKESTSTGKILAIEKIQQAYSGTTLSNNGIYKYILLKTSDEDKLGLAETILLNNNFNFTTNDDGGEQVVDFNGNDEYTKLLLHMDGTDNGTTFTDSSTGTHTITPKYNKIWTFTKPDGTTSMESFYSTNTGTASGRVLSNKYNINVISDGINYNQGIGNFDFDLTGDFDIQVDFDTSNFIAPTTGTNYFGMNFKGEDTTNGQNYTLLRIYRTSSTYVYQLTYRLDGSYSYINSSSGLVGTSGKIKINRSGSNWTASYWNGSAWIIFAQQNLWNINVNSLSLIGRSEITNVNFSVNFDNFQINSATVINPPSVLTKTGEKEFGTASAYFGGDVSYLSVPYNNNFDFGTGDFTIDGWIKYTTLQNFNPIIQKGDADLTGWKFDSNSTNNLRFHPKIGGVWGGIILQDTATLQTGQWYHVAVVRSGSNFYLFKNGVIVDTKTSSSAIDDQANSLIIGNTPSLGRYLNGYIDELRISKGIARWTSNFTPPSAPYGN